MNLIKTMKSLVKNKLTFELELFSCIVNVHYYRLYLKYITEVTDVSKNDNLNLIIGCLAKYCAILFSGKVYRTRIPIHNIDNVVYPNSRNTFSVVQYSCTYVNILRNNKSFELVLIIMFISVFSRDIVRILIIFIFVYI